MIESPISFLTLKGLLSTLVDGVNITPVNNLPKILASTWSDGVYALDDNGLTHELANQSVRGLSDDLQGGALASIDGHSLNRRDVNGNWELLARCDYEISTTFALDNDIYAGTEDARVLVLNSNQELEQIDTFASIEGRDTWFAGTAIIDGKEVGPPLGVRSLHGASNGLLFANIHVGGIPRSIDGGASWTPTIDVNLDAHEVCVDHNDVNLVAAATAEGLCISHDGGSTWTVHTEGLHSSYCSAVKIVGQQIFVAASESHFTSEGAIYSRSTKPGAEIMKKVSNGLPNWLEGIVDTACIASKSGQMAIVSALGSVYVSNNAGEQWHKRDEVVPGVSSVLIIS